MTAIATMSVIGVALMALVAWFAFTTKHGADEDDDFY